MREEAYWPHEIAGYEKNDKGQVVYTFEPVDVTISRIFPPKLDGSRMQFSTGWAFKEDTTPKGKYVGEIWGHPGEDWNADTRSYGGPYAGPVGNVGDKVKVTLSRVVTGGPKDFFNLKRLGILESAAGAANGPQPGSAASTATPAAIAPQSAPIEQRILQGMALNNLTHALAAGKTSLAAAAVDRLGAIWEGDPIEVWAGMMAAAAEGKALPLVIPAIVEAAAELDGDENGNVHLPIPAAMPPVADEVEEELPW